MQFLRRFLLLVPLLLTGLFLACAEEPQASPRFPFPRNQAYPHGIRTTLATPSGAEIQASYLDWKDSIRPYDKAVYIEKDNYAYIGGSHGYVSSELAYGMLIMVLMDNAVNNTQPKFDRLLAAYDRHLDSNGLSSWDIGFTGLERRDTAWGYYAATDADLDAALALLLAYRQWGEDRYLVRAKTLITNIWDHELDSTGNLLKPGDDWDLFKNPSYLNFAAFRLFAQVDKAHDWKRVEEASWKMLLANTSAANSPSRLPSDWCKPDGTPVAGKRNRIAFDYDAIRVPLRAGLAWSWFGDPRGHLVDSGIAAFSLNPAYGIQGRADSIRYSYWLNGSSSIYSPSGPFLLAFSGAGMVDSRFQAWVDTGYSRMANLTPKMWYTSSAYTGSLTVLTLLYMSGNFNNLWDSTAFPAPVGIASRKATPALVRTETSLQRIRLQVEGETAPEAVLLNLQGKAQRVPMHRESEALLLEMATVPRGVYLLRWTAGSRTGTQRIVH
jgi:endoglucanase